MFIIQTMRLFAFVLLSVISVQTVAAPNVLVSVPSLHSLVSGLMSGIAEPQLLLGDHGGSPDSMLSDSQLRMLANVDMIVWAGPGLEQGLDDAVRKKVPAARDKLVTLSAMVPLLENGQQGDTDPANYRNDARNLEFWADPRLSIIAIRMLTSRLVRLDPDNTEQYLDNEIALIKRLRGLEQEMANAATFLPVNLAGISPESNPYFLHRMHLPVIAATNTHDTDRTAKAGCRDPSIRNVVAGVSNYSPETRQASATAYGADFYFIMMQAEIESLLNSGCEAALSAL